MRLGLSMRCLGCHDAAWRHPEVPSGGVSDHAHLLRCARAAERGRFDMVFLADGIGVRANDEPPGSLSRSNRTVELEPPTLLAALAPVTRRIGVVCTASTADVAHLSINDFAGAQSCYASVEGCLARYGRDPGQLRIMPALVPVVGRTETEARAKLDQLQALIDPLVGLARIYGLMGDLSGHDLDGPVPEPVGAKVRSPAYSWHERSRREKLSIRQTCSEYAVGEGFRVVGTPSQVADTMEAWMDEGAADGFNITLPTCPRGSTTSWRRWCPSCSAASGSARSTRARCRGRTWACRPTPRAGRRSVLHSPTMAPGTREE